MDLGGCLTNFLMHGAINVVLKSRKSWQRLTENSSWDASGTQVTCFCPLSQNCLFSAVSVTVLKPEHVPRQHIFLEIRPEGGFPRNSMYVNKSRESYDSGEWQGVTAGPGLL